MGLVSRPRSLAVSLLVPGVVLLGGLAPGASAKSAKPPKPVIVSIGASPAEVASGATTTIGGTVENATECTITGPKKLTGLPATVPCAEGSFSRLLTLPPNPTGNKDKKFNISVTAIGAGGKAKGKVAVLESPVHYSVSPTPVVDVTGAVQVSAGQYSSCATLAGGSVDCWGLNSSGQLGRSTGGRQVNDVPAEVEDLSGASEVAAGAKSTCARRGGGTVLCWGTEQYGLLGNEVVAEEGKVKPVEVVGLDEASQISVGTVVACATLQSGHIDCWGSNQHGGLGIGRTAEEVKDASTPVEVAGISDATAVAVGGSGACALLTNGRLDCWGEYVVGDGSSESTSPEEVAGITEATQVSVGGSSACATLGDGHVECWGEDGDGQLGNGTSGGQSDEPVEAIGVRGATQVTLGNQFACARLTSGARDCWGENAEGQFGNGTTSPSDSPVEMAGTGEDSSLSAGGFHICALLANGDIECWGDNTYGQLGNGTEV